MVDSDSVTRWRADAAVELKGLVVVFLQCPKCEAGVLVKQIDPGLQVTCQQCSTVFDVTEQIEGWLAYDRPQKTEISLPPNLWLKYLPEETLQVRLPQPLQLGLSQPLAALTWLTRYFNKIVMTANRNCLMVHDVPLSGLALNKKQFNASQIEQLYLKKSFSSNSSPHLELWVLLTGGRSERLLTGLPDWLEAFYLEQKLEAILGLEDRPVAGELNHLSPYQRRRLLEWWSLAEALSLKFVPESGGGYFITACHDHQVRLDTYQQIFRNKFITYTRLRAYNRESASDYGSTEAATSLANRPTTAELKKLLIPSGWQARLKGRLEIGADHYVIHYEQLGIETNLSYLKFLVKLFCQLIEAYSKILVWGGAAIPALLEMGSLEPEYLENIRLYLLATIQNETRERLSRQPSQWWCWDCRVRRVEQIQFEVGSSLYHYYGCRVCGQSQNFFQGRVVAVLDQQMEADQVAQNKVLRVNWLKYRSVFDFDEVRIIQADDQAVERLAMQIGNDTDPYRKVRYKTLICKVAPECHLSENTWKILERTFRQVEQT